MNETIQLDLVDRYQGDLEVYDYSVIATLRRNLYDKVETLPYEQAEDNLYYYITFKDYAIPIELTESIESKSHMDIYSTIEYSISANIICESNMETESSSELPINCTIDNTSYISIDSEKHVTYKYISCDIKSNNLFDASSFLYIYLNEVITNTSRTDFKFGIISEIDRRNYIEVTINKRYNLEVIIWNNILNNVGTLSI